MKYPIGIQTFDQIIENNYIYVDKTALVYKMAKEGKIYFLSRPRRFGKSLLISTLDSYFRGQKELFRGLAIDKLEEDWLEYPVFHIDFNGVDFTVEGKLKETIDAYLNEWEKIYGEAPKTDKRFSFLLRRAYEKFGRRAVVLIDEYDKPILDVLDSPLEEKNRNVLKAFYSTFKAADASLQFVLLTGVTKFSQVSVFSGFNQPNDISMDGRYEALCGITQEELYHYFAEPIEEIAKAYNRTADEMKELLKRQYDGYHFGENLTDMYNPFSILNAFSKMKLMDYWFATGTPTYLIKLLRHNNEQLNELTGRYYDPSLFVDYKADVEKPLAMIYQSGYLTIKGYDMEMNRYLLDFPNNEVKRGLLTMTAANYLRPRDEVSSWVGDAVILLREGETEAFRESLTAFLSSIPYDSHESLKTAAATERHFQYTFYLILRLMGVYCKLEIEKRQAKGRVDCIIEMKDYVYVFEFKLDGTAAEALQQIEDKGYARPYLSDSRQLYIIGVSFSSATMTVGDWEIRMFEK